MAKKTVWLPYDFDTAIGINNEGTLSFSYDLEDTDTFEGADVYNGQDSILWQNVRAAYASELATMYRTLRSTVDLTDPSPNNKRSVLSYEKTEAMFEEHQNKWPEAIFNEDAQFKYLDPLINDGDGAYLSMLQGSKEEQRKWWLWNRFRYLDSKYQAGDALTQLITLRGYETDDITITPYASIYATIKYGSSVVQERAPVGVPVTLECPLDRLNDTEIYIYSADQISSIGDLSGIKVGYANFAFATKLTSLKIGDGDSNYSNPNLGARQTPALTLGNNTLLQTLDVRNCPNLTESIDISNCTNIEYVYFTGTNISGINLPNGGIMKELYLPNTISSLIVKNQPMLDTIVIADGFELSTLVLENVSTAFDSYALVKTMAPGSAARLINIDWTIEDCNEIMDLLSTLKGLDVNGYETPEAQLTGHIHFTRIREWQLANITNRYPYLTITYTYLHENLTKAFSRKDGAGNDLQVMGAQTWDGLTAFKSNTPHIPHSYYANNSAYHVQYFPDITSINATLFNLPTNSYKTIGFGKQTDTEVIPLGSISYIGNSAKPATIYVPDNLVDAYKEATNWSNFASVIYPLSEFNIYDWSSWTGKPL